MKTQMRFIGFKSFDHHKDYLNNLIVSTLGQFDTHNKFDCDLTIRKESKKYNPALDFYVCELNFFGDQKRGHLFFKKTGKTMYEAAKKVSIAAEKSLRRESRTRRSRMRKLFKNADDFNSEHIAA